MIARLALTMSLALAVFSAPATAQGDAAHPKADRKDIYDAKADATRDVEAAIAKAKKENTRVLIQWGANWCGWCHLLHDLFKSNREVSRELLYEYEVVLVDIGKVDKNIDLAKRYGVAVAGADGRVAIQGGLPFLTVLDGNGKVLVNQETGALEKQNSEKPQHDVEKVMSFLTKYEARPLSAESVLAEGLNRARREKKQVFLHFGAPWCGWCHRMEDWMALPEVHKVLSTEFVDVKIDVDRMIGGPDMKKRYTGEAPTGIPWFALVSPDGKTVATSNIMPGDKNVGCPWSDEEKALFRALLEKHARRLTGDQIDGILAKLGPPSTTP